MDEDIYKRRFKENLPNFINNVNPEQLLPYLPCLTEFNVQEIQACQNGGQLQRAMMSLYQNLIRRPNWWLDLTAALRNPQIGLDNLANLIDGGQAHTTAKKPTASKARKKRHSRDSRKSNKSYNEDVQVQRSSQVKDTAVCSHDQRSSPVKDTAVCSHDQRSSPVKDTAVCSHDQRSSPVKDTAVYSHDQRSSQVKETAVCSYKDKTVTTSKQVTVLNNQQKYTANMSLSELPPLVMKEVAMLDHQVLNNWRALAEVLAYSLKDVQDFEAHSLANSPTRAMLKHWEETKGATLLELLTLLLTDNLNRLDIVHDILEITGTIEGLEGLQQTVAAGELTHSFKKLTLACNTSEVNEHPEELEQPQSFVDLSTGTSKSIQSDRDDVKYIPALLGVKQGSALLGVKQPDGGEHIQYSQANDVDKQFSHSTNDQSEVVYVSSMMGGETSTACTASSLQKCPASAGKPATLLQEAVVKVKYEQGLATTYSSQGLAADRESGGRLHDLFLPNEARPEKQTLLKPVLEPVSGVSNAYRPIWPTTTEHRLKKTGPDCAGGCHSYIHNQGRQLKVQSCSDISSTEFGTGMSTRTRSEESSREVYLSLPEEVATASRKLTDLQGETTSVCSEDPDVKTNTCLVQKTSSNPDITKDTKRQLSSAKEKCCPNMAASFSLSKYSGVTEMKPTGEDTEESPAPEADQKSTQSLCHGAVSNTRVKSPVRYSSLTNLQKGICLAGGVTLGLALLSKHVK